MDVGANNADSDLDIRAIQLVRDRNTGEIVGIAFALDDLLAVEREGPCEPDSNAQGAGDRDPVAQSATDR